VRVVMRCVARSRSTMRFRAAVADGARQVVILGRASTVARSGMRGARRRGRVRGRSPRHAVGQACAPPNLRADRAQHPLHRARLRDGRPGLRALRGGTSRREPTV
jgi:hypothetical protein